MVKIKLELAFFGDLLNPVEFSNLININPTNYWYKGDELPSLKGVVWKGTNRPIRKETAWEYATEYIETYDMEYLVDLLLDKFRPCINIISQYVKDKNLKTKLDVVTESYDKEEKPSLFVNKRLIDFMSKTNGEIDIDMYNIY